MSCSAIVLASLDGMAKPMPMLPLWLLSELPRLAIELLMPMSSPLAVLLRSCPGDGSGGLDRVGDDRLGQGILKTNNHVERSDCGSFRPVSSVRRTGRHDHLWSGDLTPRPRRRGLRGPRPGVGAGQGPALPETVPTCRSKAHSDPPGPAATRPNRHPQPTRPLTAAPITPWATIPQQIAAHPSSLGSSALVGGGAADVAEGGTECDRRRVC